MKTAGSRLSDKNQKMLEKLTSILSGMELIKIFPVGTKLTNEYEAANKEYFRIQKSTNRLSAGLEALNCIFDLTSTLAFLGLGIWFVSQNRIRLGALTALYSLYGTFRYVFLEIGQYLPQIRKYIYKRKGILRPYTKRNSRTDCLCSTRTLFI